MALLRAIVVFPTLLLFNVSSAADIPCGTAVFGKGAHNGKNRMVGANVATPHAYPWHVFIQTPKGTFSGSAVRFSSGNVIDAVLTSAQVVTVNDKLISPTNVTVYLGLHDRAKKAKARAKVHSIKRFSLSDSPRVQMTASDAAVLYLKLPVPLSDYIRPICLPDEEQVEPNDSCVITGLNHISIQRPTSNLLHAMQLRILPAKSCSKLYAFYNDSEHYCMGTSLANICPGDAGSPVVCQKNGRWVQMAFAMVGADCDRKEHIPSLLSRATQQKVFRSKAREVRTDMETHPAKTDDTTYATRNLSLKDSKQEHTDKGSLQDYVVKKETTSGKEKRSTVSGAHAIQNDKQSDNHERDSLKGKNQTASMKIKTETKAKQDRSADSDALNGTNDRYDSTKQPNGHKDAKNATEKETSSEDTLRESKAAADFFNSTMNKSNEGKEGQNITANESRREGNDNETKQSRQMGMTDVENKTDYKASEERTNANGPKGENSSRTERDFSHAENASSKAQLEKPTESKKDNSSNEERHNKQPQKTEEGDSNEEQSSQKETKNKRKENGPNEEDESIESSENGSLRKNNVKSDQQAKSPDLEIEIADDEGTGQRNGTAALHERTTVNENEKTESRIPKIDLSSAVGHRRKKKSFDKRQDGDDNAVTSSKEAATTMESIKTIPNDEQSNIQRVQKNSSTLQGKLEHTASEDDENTLPMEKGKLGGAEEKAVQQEPKELQGPHEIFIRDKENAGTNCSRRPEANQSASSPTGHDLRNESTEGHSSNAESNIPTEMGPNTANRSKGSAEKDKLISLAMQSGRNVASNRNNTLTEGHKAEQRVKSEEKKEDRPANLKGDQHTHDGMNSTMASVNTKTSSGGTHSEAVRHIGSNKQHSANRDDNVKSINDESGNDEFAKRSENFVNDSLAGMGNPSDLRRSEQKGNSQLKRVELNDMHAKASTETKEKEKEEEEEVWKTEKENGISDNDKKTNSANEGQNTKGDQKKESSLNNGIRHPIMENEALFPKRHNEGINNVAMEQPNDGASLQSDIPKIGKENSLKKSQEGEGTHIEEFEHRSNETASSRGNDLQDVQRNDNRTVGLWTAAPNVANTKNKKETKPEHEEANSVKPLSPSERMIGNSSTGSEVLKGTQAATPFSFFARAVKTITDAYASARKRLAQ